MIPFLATHTPRLVSAMYPDMLWRVSSEEKVAYLTFDDGPTEELTNSILNVLAQFDAKATFFVLGARAECNKELIHRMHRLGHTIGNHTFSHPDAWLKPTRQVLDELERTADLLETLVESPVRLARPPYGHFTRSMRRWCTERRQRLVMWDLMPGDFLPGATAPRLSSHVVRYVRPGSIIVLHDNPTVSKVVPETLMRVLDTLTSQGWKFKAL